MGLNLTETKRLLKSVNEMIADNKINSAAIDRNCTVLPDDYKLSSDFTKIKPELRFTPGMVRFEYKDWDGIIRRVEGFVCSLEDGGVYNCSVKLWTAKHEMISIRLSCTLGLNVIELPQDYKPKLENTDDF